MQVKRRMRCVVAERRHFKPLRTGYAVVDMPYMVEGIWVAARLLLDRSSTGHRCRIRGCSSGWGRGHSQYYQFPHLRAYRTLLPFAVGRGSSGCPVHGKGVVDLRHLRFRIGCRDDR